MYLTYLKISKVYQKMFNVCGKKVHRALREGTHVLRNTNKNDKEQ